MSCGQSTGLPTNQGIQQIKIDVLLGSPIVSLSVPGCISNKAGPEFRLPMKLKYRIGQSCITARLKELHSLFTVVVGVDFRLRHNHWNADRHAFQDLCAGGFVAEKRRCTLWYHCQV